MRKIEFINPFEEVGAVEEDRFEIHSGRFIGYRDKRGEYRLFSKAIRSIQRKFHAQLKASRAARAEY